MRAHNLKRISACVLALLILIMFPRLGRSESADQQPGQQVISRTGLLPVYGLDFDFDPSWVDRAEFPANSAAYPDFGVSAPFQKLWDAVKPAGFNVIRFKVDARDDKSAVNQIANLCGWAKNNGIQLVPVLTGSEPAQMPGPQFPAQAAAVVTELIAALQKAGPQSLQQYTQIMCYQIENDLNHAGLHGASTQQSSQQLLLAPAAAMRKAEQDALKGSGLNATPLAVNASFDYELVNAGAIAGATLGDAAYSQAYDSIKRFLGGLASSTDIDAICVDWFPGSISGGAADRFTVLLHSLESDLAGKQILLTTGFSTGFRSADDQKNFYALAFANLADYRAHEGQSSPFAGLLFHEALNGSEANPPAPSPDLPASMAAWDWTAKAGELQRMWSGQAPSAALGWWLKKVTNNMGLASLSLDGSGGATVAIQPAGAGLIQIAGSVSQGNSNGAANSGPNTTTATASPGPNSTTATAASGSDPAGGVSSSAQTLAGAGPQTLVAASSQTPAGASPQTPGFGQSLAGELEKGLVGLMDHVFDRIGNMIGGAGSASAGSQFNPNQPGIQQPGGASFPSAGGAPGGQPNPTQSGGQQPGGASFPSAGSARASISLSRQDVTIQPSNPRAGQQATFSVTLHNQSPDVDASGLVVALTDETGNVLSQVTDVSVARNSAQTVTSQWTPPDARLFKVTARVTDSALNELASASIAPVNVNAGQNTGTQPGAPSSTDTSGANAATTRFSAGLGAPQMQALTVGSQGQPVIAGQPAGVTLRVSNPYSRAITNLNANLTVDGKPTQAKSMGSLLSHQSRSLLFADVAFAQPGNHQVTVTLEGGRAMDRKATAQTQVTALEKAPPGSNPVNQPVTNHASSASVRPIVPPVGATRRLAAPAVQQSTAVRAMNPPQSSVRPVQGQGTVLSGQAGAAHQSPAKSSQASGGSSSPSQTPVRPVNPDVKPAPKPQTASPGPARPAEAVLTVSRSEIQFEPAHPKAKQPIEFLIPVHNAGRGDVNRARIICTVYADGRAALQKEFDPVIKAGQSYLARLGVEAPAAREILLEVIVGADGAAERAGSRASISVSIAAADTPRRH